MVTAREFEVFQLCAKGPGAVSSLLGEYLTHQGLWGQQELPDRLLLLDLLHSAAPPLLLAVSHGKPNPSLHRVLCPLLREWATNYMGTHSGGVRASGRLIRSDFVRPGPSFLKAHDGSEKAKETSITIRQVTSCGKVTCKRSKWLFGTDKWVQPLQVTSFQRGWTSIPAKWQCSKLQDWYC